MKKIVLLLVSVVMVSTEEAKKKEEPVIMTVSDKKIPLSEFIFMAMRDNSGVDLNDKKSVDNFVELFKNLKLKVEDAESLGLHKTPDFEKDLANYKRQLGQNFLSDKAGEEAEIRALYERLKFVLGFKFIMFSIPMKQSLAKDTVAPYKQAVAALQRIKEGESFEAVGEDLAKNTKDMEVKYETISHLFPLQIMNVLEKVIYEMEPGDIAGPVRAGNVFHLFKLDRKIPNPGNVRVAQILTSFPSDDPSPEEIEQTRVTADSIYRLAMAGADFAELAIKYSADSTYGPGGGLLPYFRLGQMLEPIEEAAFALKDTGEISQPLQTRFGFHILQLKDRKPLAPYEEIEPQIYQSLANDMDRHADFYRSFDEKMKERHNYIFYPEAYAELEQLAETAFPLDSNFYFQGLGLDKTLMRLDTFDFPQHLFVRYLYTPKSNKTFSLDLMQEVYDQFVRSILREMEMDVLERDYADYNLQLNEYYDGSLLFEISNKRIWSYPEEKQEELEAEWVTEINKKYPVTINRKILKNIRKYLN